MAKTIFDISRQLGLEAIAVLAKAKELGIVSAKVVSSSIDDITAEWLEEELLKTNPIVIEKHNAFGTAKHLTKRGADLPTPQNMKPCLIGRRIVEVLATIAWASALKHRVYSCPDTPEFDFVSGATALILRNSKTGVRLPLEVCAVTRMPANRAECLNGLSQPFRDRAEKYLAEVADDTRIIQAGCAHRLYFLGTEPWPAKMQKLTASVPPTEWSAILSICTEPDRFFRWPRIGGLLWKGCVRADKDGEYSFPDELVSLLRRLELTPDTRTNGPAINSFQAAGGERPKWNCEGWHIHHVFDGTEGSTHAVKDGDLFTHSAGLVAAHPVAHDFAHRSALLKWLLRREAYLRFGFDPKGDFIDT